MRVLGIETSCDETGIAIYDSERGLLADGLYSQVAMHAPYGGIVPELASRDHVRKTLPLIMQVLKEAELQKTDIEGIAYTKGPGLIGALLVGASIAKALGFAWDIPAIGVHHMEAHLLSPRLEDRAPQFPFIALLVSGGHTMLVQVNAFRHYQVLGESLDDAVGEAFDKTAKLLGLSYPGGPEISALAKKGNVTRFKFPRPMVNRPGLDFSCSGLKTFTMNTLQQTKNTAQDRADIANAFQRAVVETLVIKAKRALKQTGMRQLVVAGGVSANELLREKLNHEMKKLNATVFYPRSEFCTDNGAMIAYAGCLHLLAGHQDDLTIQVRPKWPLGE